MGLDMKDHGKIHNSSKAIRRISRMIFLVGGAGGMTVMTLLILCDVGMRSFFNRPIMSSYEMVMFLMSVVVFASLGYTQSEKKVVRIELVVSLLPGKLQVLFEIITSFLSLGIVLLIAWRNVVRCMELRQEQVISPVLHLPVYPFYGVAAFGFLLLSSVIFMDILESFETFGEKE
ncbi:TRAP transporter small permease [Deltaproteobacteria bacterium]|nr:TRAP transporter small permease [Deltaproteobacteria bacterium]